MVLAGGVVGVVVGSAIEIIDEGGGDPESVCLIPRANPVNVQLYEALYLTRYVQLASLLLNR